MNDHNPGMDLAHALSHDMETVLLEAAHHVLAKARENAPVGDPALDPNPAVSLKEAGTVERIQTPFGTMYRVEFDTEYAAVQEFAHYRHPRGGGSHYLERALTEVIAELPTLIATAARSGRT